MTTELTKAAQQALEALKNVTDYDQINAARRALQSALTQRPAEQAGPDRACGVMHLIEDYAKAVHDGDDALCQVLIRTIEASLLTSRQATPDQFADASKMVSPVALRSVRLTRDTAGMCVVRVNGRVAIRDNGDIIDHTATLEWFADTQQATPEPVGEPWGWAIEDKHGVAQAIRPARKEFFGCVQSSEPFTAEDVSKMDREWAGLAPHRIVTLYTRPAPGVPEWLPAVLTDWGFDVHDDEEGRTWLLIRNDQDDVARLSAPTFWPASGRQTIGAVVLHQFSAALTSALAAAQAKGGGHE